MRYRQRNSLGGSGSDPAPDPAGESAAERTDLVPVVGVDDPGCLDGPGCAEALPDPPRADPDAVLAEELLGGPETAPRPRGRPPRLSRRIGQGALGLAGLLIALLAVYLADVLVNLGEMPRGVTVRGVEVGGMPRDRAEAKLRRVLGPGLSDPVPIRAGDVLARLDPSAAGLRVDWSATLAQVGGQPLNPISRVASLFTTREIGVVTTVNPSALRAAVAELAETRINHPPVAGSIGFEPVPGTAGAVHAFAIEPRHGQHLADIDAAVRRIRENWLTGGVITLPVRVHEVRASAAGVRATLEHVVRPMVSEPVRVSGAGAEAVLRPATIASALRFSPLPSGELRVTVKHPVLKRAVLDQLTGTERPAHDARLVFVDARPAVRPGEPGRQIDWEATFDSFTEVASRDEQRVLPVQYRATAPEVSTAELESLGITEIIGQFGTDGLSGAVAENIRRVAAEVNGTLVKPGETFRLNEHAAPYTGANGYLPAPLYGREGAEVVPGGGVSLFTSTLYNAAYLAGLTDAGHTAYRQYMARFPAARGAVSLSPEGDPVPMAFTNDTATAVLIRASVSDGKVTVTLWGTRHYRVESVTGERSAVVRAPVEHSTTAGCEARDGTPGFTVTNVRVLYDAETGERLQRENTTVSYEPRAAIRCHGHSG